MGNHVDTRSRKTKVREHDELARRKRATFKQYLRNIEEDLQENFHDDIEIDILDHDNEDISDS